MTAHRTGVETTTWPHFAARYICTCGAAGGWHAHDWNARKDGWMHELDHAPVIA